MAISYCAILPHSPILIPEIGKGNRDILKKTVESYQTVKQEMKEAGIDNIIIISPHGPVQASSFMCQSGISMKLGGKEIGFLGSRKKLSSDLSLSQSICENMRSQGLDIWQTNPEVLDYGASIPLELLIDESFHPKITVINKAEELGMESHYRAGIAIGQALDSSDSNCAVIASADLSHRLKKSSPAGYSPKGAKFDNRLIEYLNDPETAAEKIINLDANLMESARSCGIKGIAVLIGAISEKKYLPEVLSYQTELGVGYLSFAFRLEK